MDGIDIVTSEVDTLQGLNERSQMEWTDLNDDCLIHILSMLSNTDLANVANLWAANARFCNVCGMVFAKRKYWPEIYNYGSFEDITVAKNILDRFGDLIKSFTFNCQTRDIILTYPIVGGKNYNMRNYLHDFYRTVIERCSNTLERISFIRIDNDLKITKPFPKVKSLFFSSYCFHHSLSEIHKLFPSVERISFNKMYSFETFFGLVPQRIPSLKHFQFHHDIFPDLTQFDNFIALNPQLRYLSTSLDNGNEDKWWSKYFFFEKSVPDNSTNDRNVNARLMSIKITDQHNIEDCAIYYRLAIPHKRVKIIDLSLRSLNAAEFITKCRNIKKLRLHLQFDSRLFNEAYFNQIASALPLLEELVLAIDIRKRNDYKIYVFDQDTHGFVSITPFNDPNKTEHKKGNIRAILPFISQCRELVKIQFGHFLESYWYFDDEKTELLKHIDEDFRGFEKIVRKELPNWTAHYKEVDTPETVGYTCVYSLIK